MAELYPLDTLTRNAASLANRAAGAQEGVPRPEGPGPLWRSLLFPLPGQRAVQLGGDGSNLFRSLREAGVRFEPERGPAGPGEAGDFDLVLEDRTAGTPPRHDRIGSMLAPGGRWIVVLEKKRWVGLAGQRILRRARREGFTTVETFHAYPSLRTPRILVPLDRFAPFRYFLSVAVGIRGPRQRLFALGARCLHLLRLHRMFLSNLIVVARRSG